MIVISYHRMEGSRRLYQLLGVWFSFILCLGNIVRVSDSADVGDEKLDMEDEPLSDIFAFGCAKQGRSSNVP